MRKIRRLIDFSAKQHLAFCIFSLTCLQWQSISTLSYSYNDLYFSLGALLGCLLPDSDHKKAIAGYIIPLHLFFKHGRQTHTILASLIFIGIWLGAKHDVWLGIWFGFIGHLLGDNWQGNNLKFLYYPFKRGKK